MTYVLHNIHITQFSQNSTENTSHSVVREFIVLVHAPTIESEIA